MSDFAVLTDYCSDCLAQLAEQRPFVHCITNNVAMPFTANVLLSAGAHPSMTFDPTEVVSFTGRAAALSINIGTLDATRRAAIPLAIAAAKQTAKPWVLDPVMATASEERMKTALEIAAQAPTVIRGNAAEINALSAAAANTDETIIVSTGTIDTIRQGDREVSIENGHALMDRVTAMGCAESALVAAFLSVAEDLFLGAAAATLAFGIAGEIAGSNASGPGSFEPALLDALYTLDKPTITAKAKVS